jgi:hypothetical protein
MTAPVVGGGGRALLRQRGGLAVLELRIRPEARDFADGEALLLREPDLLDGGRALVGESLVSDEHLRLGVLNDVRDLRAHEVEVDRDEIKAGLERGEVQLENLDAVRQHHRHRVAGLETERAQPVDDLVGRLEQLTRPHLALVGIDDRQLLGLLPGDAPESELGHYDALLTSSAACLPAAVLAAR